MNKKECKSDNSNRQAKQYGYFFNIDEAKWKLDSGSSVNVGGILKFIHSSLIEGYINTLAFYASNYSAGYVRRINVIMKDFFIRTNSIFVSEFDILNYRSLIS
ncbi:TPA: integrase, partial [Klebsiella pneumoniae]|nr:integrase [Klebsiella pneumoniae]